MLETRNPLFAAPDAPCEASLFFGAMVTRMLDDGAQLDPREADFLARLWSEIDRQRPPLAALKSRLAELFAHAPA